MNDTVSSIWLVSYHISRIAPMKSATDGDEVLLSTSPSSILKGAMTTPVDNVLKSSQQSGTPRAVTRRPLFTTRFSQQLNSCATIEQMN